VQAARVDPTNARGVLSEAADDIRPVALAALDASLHIAEVNAEMSVLTGIPPEALVGRRAEDVFAPVWSTLELACLEVLRSAEPRGPLRFRAPNGGATRPTPWLVRLRPIREDDGRAVGVALAAVDETEHRLVRDQLRQAQKMEALGRLAGGIAHDFNNLLTAIGGYTGLVLDELPGEDARREDLDEVLKAVERARVLTLRLLAFSRRAATEPQVTPVDEVVRDTERLLRRLIGDDIQVHTLLRARGAVYLQAGELEQVLVNLVVNARDAMPGGGSLTLETQDVVLEEPVPDGVVGAPAGEYVQVTVADTGVGMDLATQARIFEPFFTTKPAGEGTGLGLATVFVTVKQARGEIAVQSRPGDGTRFEVYLPRMRGAQAAAAVDRPVARGTETVLLVEDQAQVRSAMVRMLDGLGYTVTGVASPLEALERCVRAETRPDLLVTDVVLPIMAGPELARRCQALAPDLTVLYVSGFSAGVAVKPLLIKPFDQRSLGLKVRDVLDA